MYACPPMPPTPCPPECLPSKPSYDPSAKYYREIGTSVIGNQLIIRMEREKGKSKKSGDWDPPCDCDVVEIQRPTSKEGPKILKGPDNNRILFRVESKSTESRKNNNDPIPQAISYEVGQCKGGPYTNDQCRTFTIYPVLDRAGAQEVHTDRVTDGDENVFMLKVKNKPDSEDRPRRNVELELRTPRPPTPPSQQPEAHEQVSGKRVSPEEIDCTPTAVPREPLRKKKKRRKK
ncbi:uncharacterized protein LOC143428222 [Xylocopa sonorina]|uniref:uncharacterized protein LOC143428222 n=1 Tax=Xylocopa sonorina TaxID=1818115 RepID=UPI00403ABECB